MHTQLYSSHPCGDSLSAPSINPWIRSPGSPYVRGWGRYLCQRSVVARPLIAVGRDALCASSGTSYPNKAGGRQQTDEEGQVETVFRVVPIGASRIGANAGEKSCCSKKTQSKPNSASRMIAVVKQPNSFCPSADPHTISTFGGRTRCSSALCIRGTQPAARRVGPRKFLSYATLVSKP